MGKAKVPFDHQLRLGTIPVRFLDGSTGVARAEGNNAAWHCVCAAQLVGRCYFQFGDVCHTVCPECSRHYRVLPDARKRATEVVEEQPLQLALPAA